MADAMISRPPDSCYSFNVDRGSLCDPLGGTWHPNNPNYDPGPPPPPKPPKEKKEEKKTGVQTEGDTKVPGEVSRQPMQLARGNQRHQKHGGGFNSRRDRSSEAVSGQTNGLQRLAETSGGPRRGWVARQARGGRGRGAFDKYVRGLFRTLRHA